MSSINKSKSPRRRDLAATGASGPGLADTAPFDHVSPRHAHSQQASSHGIPSHAAAPGSNASAQSSLRSDLEPDDEVLEIDYSPNTTKKPMPDPQTSPGQPGNTRPRRNKLSPLGHKKLDGLLMKQDSPAASNSARTSHAVGGQNPLGQGWKPPKGNVSKMRSNAEVMEGVKQHGIIDLARKQGRGHAYY